MSAMFDIIDRRAQAIIRELEQGLGELRELFATAEGREGPGEGAGQPIEWTLVETRDGITYSWPDGNIDRYDSFDVYQGAGLLAIGRGPTASVKGRPRRYAVVFQLGVGGGSPRPVTTFVEADDFESSGELVSVIRGKGASGRQMFAPGDALPDGYENLRVERFADRIAGHYDRLAVVAHEDDAETMLDHAEAQIRTRRL
jgi:hypothetical protein